MAKGTLIAHATCRREVGTGVAAVNLYDDGTVEYNTRIAVTSGTWQSAESVPVRDDADLVSVSISCDGDRRLVLSVAYSDGQVLFAVVERNVNWQKVHRRT